MDSAAGISADGRYVVGYGRTSTGGITGYLADLAGTDYYASAVPEPSGIALLAIGAGALLGLRSRRSSPRV